MELEDLGRLAYDAHGEAMGWRRWERRRADAPLLRIPVPAYDDLSAQQRALWQAVGLAVAKVAYHAGLERAAQLVCPEPHVDEDRDCRDIAARIRAEKRA